MKHAQDSKDGKEKEGAGAALPSEETAGDAPAEAPKRRRLSGKRLVLFIILPLVLLLGGGVGAHVSGLAKSILGYGEDKARTPAHQAVFYNLPEFLVNLNSPGRRTTYLKLSISLELERASDIARVEAVMPRIIDNFQVYLRELRVEDLHGSAGLYRLREELLARVNTAAQPAKINDVLFKEMLVQ
ncbi:MAG: flagellar basal body-associated FliL family protein [Pseudomonadota bacterium]